MTTDQMITLTSFFFGSYLLFHVVSLFHNSRAEGFRKGSLFSVSNLRDVFLNVRQRLSNREP